MDCFVVKKGVATPAVHIEAFDIIRINDWVFDRLLLAFGTNQGINIDLNLVIGRLFPLNLTTVSRYCSLQTAEFFLQTDSYTVVGVWRIRGLNGQIQVALNQLQTLVVDGARLGDDFVGENILNKLFEVLIDLQFWLAMAVLNGDYHSWIRRNHYLVVVNGIRLQELVDCLVEVKKLKVSHVQRHNCLKSPRASVR